MSKSKLFGNEFQTFTTLSVKNCSEHTEFCGVYEVCTYVDVLVYRNMRRKIWWKKYGQFPNRPPRRLASGVGVWQATTGSGDSSRTLPKTRGRSPQSASLTTTAAERASVNLQSLPPPAMSKQTRLLYVQPARCRLFDRQSRSNVPSFRRTLRLHCCQLRRILPTSASVRHEFHSQTIFHAEIRVKRWSLWFHLVYF